MDIYAGIDLGGTEIKTALTTKDGAELGWACSPTLSEEGFDSVVNRMADTLRVATRSCNIELTDIDSVGLGVPGMVAGDKGPVVFAPNVGWVNEDPVPALEKELGLPVYIDNDAVCAALAESKCGTGKRWRNMVMLTLGTAVGGAVIFDGKLLRGFGRYGGELGHIPLCHGGLPCSCGIQGCFEQYGSAVALARIGRQAAASHPGSLLARRCEDKSAKSDAQAVFSAAADGDEAAVAALDEFTTYLTEGIAGLVNVFRPDAVVLGGGLSNAGAALLEPVNRKLPGMVYASSLTGAPPVVCAALGVSAGSIGAAMLAAQCSSERMIKNG